MNLVMNRRCAPAAFARRGRIALSSLLPSLILALAFTVHAEAQTDEAQTAEAETAAAAETKTVAAKSSAEVARSLSSRNPIQRREAAEELARQVATEHLKLVEGYRLQEREARVRLALDWALYRMGKNEALFQLVRALDSARYEQTLGYLSQLETPEPLYIFIKRTNGNTQIKLLEVLARIGDATTLEQLKPLTASLDPLIAEAAKFAEREITIRLEETPATEPKRPRQVGVKENDTP
jgi:hypothetical protein